MACVEELGQWFITMTKYVVKIKLQDVEEVLEESRPARKEKFTGKYRISWGSNQMIQEKPSRFRLKIETEDVNFTFLNLT
jgi:hypothetical protein